MADVTALAVDAHAELSPMRERVVARLFLPGERTPGGGSRTQAVLDRVLSLPPDVLADSARRLRTRAAGRSPSFLAGLLANGAVVRPPDAGDLADDAALVLGAAFTAEHAIEGAALCNPSAVVHPDQSGLAPGRLRVLVSLRSIGEGHLSSIQFCEALIGPGHVWEFLPRQTPPCLPAIEEGDWDRDHFLRALEHDGGTDELVRSIAQVLPERFGSATVEQAVQELRAPYLHHPRARAQLESMRIVADSAYRADFPEDSDLSMRVLLPVADEERQGIEDLRLVRSAQDGPAYRGTFTAYDGRSISSRLLTTNDFRSFSVHRLIGPPARTKGMALFPRPVAGEYLALTRGDGESIGLARSGDGLDWSAEEPLRSPQDLWEIVQTGNCGSPIETAQGWIVLTHGVGVMRAYSIGALLLDLDDPRQVIGALPAPLIDPPDVAGGYVPNVVYTCGGLVHDGTLWIPYGVDDQRIRVAHVRVAALLAAMEPPRPPQRRAAPAAGPGQETPDPV
ncbi:putative GH43/DUF377 family glycosyl hydrolase [Microbacterium resistens]|uniref:GH43/DUF377 family glycosyl hydrolase n=1 Tax=Microbacterium resistens TaxID=156977 RepID=A0ABU1SGP4_9MICO|nr:glycosylase [Microbacterium resistens]MDR6868782.1 putative GH43/DUF377 family glycosyl hydrolase [Microbacterium resistens]